jgi:hypothetical protein
MTDIVKQLQVVRQNLLDLTMRNRLLNFRPTKLKTIQLIDGRFYVLGEACTFI